MEFRNITLEKQEGIARLTINRPPVNVINFETLIEINTALEELGKDEETKVLLIRGSGGRAFSAGVEVKEHLGEMVPKMMREFGNKLCGLPMAKSKYILVLLIVLVI